MKPFDLPTVRPDADHDALDPIDSRYYDAEIARYLSERSRLTFQAYMEAALAQTLADYGVCSRESADAIEASARKITAEAVTEEEKITRHDVKALVNTIKAGIDGAAKPYVHFGATSYDIVSSAYALQMRAAVTEVVIPRLRTLIKTLAGLAEQYADTVQIGRTHGQHALPITFGFAIAEYVVRLGESTERLEQLADELRGKFSGAVGAYNALSMFVPDPLEFETKVLEKVGLKPAAYSTQIAPPEGMVRLMDELTVAAGIMANLGHDMRHLQRSEIAETREKFEKGQAGSSTMAHKRNPWNFENVVGMSKEVIAQMVNANLNLSSEHQRDLTDSASARFYPVTVACVASMAQRLDKVMNKIEVDPEAMERNLKLTGGAIAAEPLYLLLAKYGHTTAHEVSKELSQRAMEQGVPLHEAAQNDPEVSQYWSKFTDQEKAIITEPEEYYTGLAASKAHQIAQKWST